MIGGGPCAFNPEPLADFFDLFLIGDGEESLPELIETVRRAKRRALSKQELLKECTKLDGVYVPAFYEPVYDRTGKLVEYKKLYNTDLNGVKVVLDCANGASYIVAEKVYRDLH